MGDYFLERQIINKAIKAEKIAKEIIYQVSEKIKQKSLKLKSKIPQQLMNKMCDRDQPDIKQFPCQKCGKVFDDGRKLGGHISRAHPTIMRGSKSEKSQQWKKKKNYPKINLLMQNQLSQNIYQDDP